MSDNNKDNAALNTYRMQGGNQTIKKKCRECNTDNIFIVPQYEIVNSYGISMLVFPHPDPQACEKCGRKFQMALRAVDQIAVSFFPMKEDDNKSQILSASADILSKLH